MWLSGCFRRLDVGPLLFAVDVLCKIDQEEISDQKNEIMLQKKLISKKAEELGRVSKTVENGLKSYSSVLQESCATDLSPKNFATAVKKIIKDADQSRQMVVFGVDKETGPKGKITGILEQLEERGHLSRDAQEDWSACYWYKETTNSQC